MVSGYLQANTIVKIGQGQTFHDITILNYSGLNNNLYLYKDDKSNPYKTIPIPGGTGIIIEQCAANYIKSIIQVVAFSYPSELGTNYSNQRTNTVDSDFRVDNVKVLYSNLSPNMVQSNAVSAASSFNGPATGHYKVLAVLATYTATVTASDTITLILERASGLRGTLATVTNSDTINTAYSIGFDSTLPTQTSIANIASFDLYNGMKLSITFSSSTEFGAFNVFYIPVNAPNSTGDYNIITE